MKKFYLIMALAAFALMSCSKNGESADSQFPVKIDPVITKATSTNFEQGDQIGLAILKGGSEYASNACLTYSEADKCFSGDLKWYPQGGESCSLRAFYPYQASGFPSKFSVAADQSTGADKSDFMVAFKSNVFPQQAAVSTTFKHCLSQIIVNITNTAEASVESVTIKQIIPVADISLNGEDVCVAVDGTAAKVDLKAEKVVENKQFRFIVIPQTIAFSLELAVKGAAVLVSNIPESTLKAGYTYNVNVDILPGDIKASIGGEIDNWNDGGTIDGGGVTPKVFEEHLEEGYFVYHDAKYTVAKMKDGKWWMTQNMRYVPEGYTPCSSTDKVTEGVYCPVVLNAAKTAVEFSNAAAVIAANGYLYQSEVALGKKVGDIKSEDEAKALEGAQGICPEGWHIPTSADILDLVGKAVSPLTTKTDAPYYDTAKANSSMELLNADNFNAAAWGAVSVIDNTKTSATLMGYLKTYPDAVASGYICGSSFAGITYMTTGDAESGIKNVQFYGFMPMANNGTFNGSKLSYRIAASVRCVRND